MTVSVGEPAMKATLLNMSVARRFDCGLAQAFRTTFEVVIDASLTAALRSRGLLWTSLLLVLCGDESLPGMCRRAGGSEAIVLASLLLRWMWVQFGFALTKVCG
jgi:hypothetical protein